MSNEIEVTLNNGVQTIRFNRPEKMNAFTRTMYQSIADALASGDANEEVRVHLFLGTEGCYTAGNDISD